MTVLFIDSGIGGISTLAAACKKIPNLSFVYYADDKYAPYGTKSKDFLQQRLLEIVGQFEHKINLVVLACNTATTNAVDFLRKHTKIPIIGTEPAIKPATTKTSKILLVCTPATAKSKRTHQIIAKNKSNVIILAMPNLASKIDNYFLQSKTDFAAQIQKDVQTIAKKAQNCTHIVLGCTHYCFVKEEITKNTNCVVLDGNFGVAKQIERLLETDCTKKPQQRFVLSSKNALLQKKYAKIFEQTLAKYADV